MHAFIQLPVDVTTWRLGVLFSAAIVAYGDRVWEAVARRTAPAPDLERLIDRLASDDTVAATVAARALERARTPGVDEALGRLLEHPAAEVGARAAATLQMRGGSVAEALLERHRRLERRRAAAHLPVAAPLAPHDLSRIMEQIPSLLPAASTAGALVLLGPARSHAAAALGHAMLEEGRRVLFQPARRLATDLSAAAAAGWLDVAFARLDACDLLIIDDVDPSALTPDAASLLAALTLHRAGRAATLLTSPLARAAWPAYPTVELLAA